MAYEPEEGRFSDEEEGGPVKSFLEHLEDLRWMLIKSGACVAIAVVVCLLAGNYVVEVLKWPLKRAKITYPGTNQVVTLSFGTNRLGVYTLTSEQQKLVSLGTNRFVAMQLEPVSIPNGTNSIQVLALRVDDAPDAAERSQHLAIDLINLSPAEAFLTAFHVALYAGIAIASPFIFYFLSQFIFPALKMNEKKYIYRGLGFGFGLFLIGVCFCYFILMPIALAASQAYSNWLGFTATSWKAGEYIGFVCKFMLGMGLGFEMPVVILVLVKLGLLNYQILKKARPYMIVINFVLGAVLTTPEVVTQVLMALPLQILFEISVWIAWYWERQEKKRQAMADGIIDAG
ncbi:MAG: Sec-independent protein translocase protein TatC [Pedosphaera sp.]|nr:Sec-independent protein translocase protein TatC [Pedosphaera sp.]